MEPLSVGAQRELRARIGTSRYRKRRTKEGPQGAEVVSEGKRVLDFSSNDYLGLAAHPRLSSAFTQALKQFGVGSGGSPLIGGYTRPIRELERELAEFTGRARALVFSSGYLANLGVIAGLASRRDTVFMDRLNHASLIDAGLLARAELKRYAHRDASALSRALSNSKENRKWVVTESVFSMDGDLAPLPEIASRCRDYEAMLLVDEAHGIGVYGPGGTGVSAHFGLDCAAVPLLIGTFGKALGLAGAFVAGSAELIELLIQKARTLIYCTAMPPALAASAREALAILRTEHWRRERLFELVARFREGAQRLGVPLMGVEGPIQPILLGDCAGTAAASAALMSRGIQVAGVRPPTVPEGTARLRISISAAHKETHIDRLVDELALLLCA
ncbi:MAG: 8-amino-7-oxononanoate synthase [Gammaproteobacteria bacterium]